LAYFIGVGEININDLVSKEKQKLVKDVIDKYGSLSLKTLIDNLPDGINYGEVRMVLAVNKAPEIINKP
jgi:hypothetical protein